MKVADWDLLKGLSWSQILTAEKDENDGIFATEIYFFVLKYFSWDASVTSGD